MAAPVIVPIWLIIVIILAAAAGTGVMAYFATHSVTTILFALGLLAILFVVILPNLAGIVRWGKDVRKALSNEAPNGEDKPR
ncbi:hypothetical protein [Thiorhodococcus minor]|uniref:Uncharacterized protein n=1 Tax=Thiorhodococcus minor TaxID=57489 RepID=A0A6M0JUJ2_9GAMM|nr:hypothetical protein [Thiorhodococcus minor]NEV61202.1 hypothetical protein [Thiorhodococcus minor]